MSVLVHRMSVECVPVCVYERGVHILSQSHSRSARHISPWRSFILYVFRLFFCNFIFAAHLHSIFRIYQCKMWKGLRCCFFFSIPVSPARTSAESANGKIHGLPTIYPFLWHRAHAAAAAMAHVRSEQWLRENEWINMNEERKSVAKDKSEFSTILGMN